MFERVDLIVADRELRKSVFEAEVDAGRSGPPKTVNVRRWAGGVLWPSVVMVMAQFVAG